LLIHGEHDRTVDVEHSRKMYEELKDYNAPVQYIELANGNHSLEIEANRIKTLRESVKFLDNHLSIN
jgi:dipeptidyl aminopeptidase/acylaminoacyl peptidase